MSIDALPSAGAARAAASPAAELVELVLTVVDRDTGAPVAARCCVIDCDSCPRHPLPAESCFYHEPYWIFPAYFYSCGVCTLQVPAGSVELMASRGFEYAVLVDTVEVTRDTCVVCTLSRYVDMAATDWFSGDCHVHIAHTGGVYDVYPEDARLVAESEGLNVINCLDNSYCFTGAPDPCSTAEHVVYMAQERRSRVYGHSGLLGITSLVEPLSYTTWWPLIMDLAEEVHEQPGALIICAHPMTTTDIYDIDSVGGRMLARELPIDVISGSMDAYEVLTREHWIHDRTVDMWYHVLNCGFRLPACAGTDGCVNAGSGRPAGAYQTYVQVAGTFSFDGWLEGLAEGRSFVTNGPLFTDFSVNGLALGDSLEIAGGDSAELDGTLSVVCSSALLRVDLVVNGEVDQSFFPEGDGTAIDAEFSLTLDESSWVAAKAIGVKETCFTIGERLWAHTGAVYFTLGGKRIVETESAEYLAHWVAQMETLAVTRGEWDTPSDSLRVMDELAYARSYYEALAQGAATGVSEWDAGSGGADGAGGEQTGAAIALIGPNRPNPFNASTRIPFFVPHRGDVTLQVFATSGRLVRTLVSTSLPAGWHSAAWDGVGAMARECPAGVYLCRLTGSGFAATSKMVAVR